MQRSSLPYSIFALIVISTLLLGAAVPQAVAAGPSAQRDGVRYGYSDATGKLTFVGADPSQPIDVAGVSGLSAMSAEDQALGIIDQYAGALGLSDPSQELRLEKVESFENRSILRYQQVYRGIPVMGGDLILNTQGEGYLLSLSGEVSPELALDTAVLFSAGQASEIALQAMLKWYPDEQAEFKTSEPELWIYDPRLLEDREGPIVLGWRTEVTSEGIDLPIRELVLVDAQTGNVPLHFNQIDTGWTGQMQDPAPTDTAEPTPTALPTEPPLPTDTLGPTATPLPTETLEPTAVPTEIPTEVPTEPEDVVALVATPRYVSTNGGNTGACATSVSPCRSIQYAVDMAQAGDTIYVANGTYTSTNPSVFTVNKSLTVWGGWNSDFSQQDGVSTVDGQNARGGILFTSAGLSSLIGFVVKNSVAGIDGAGIYIYHTELTIEKSTVSNNHSPGKGAGIFVYSGSALNLENSTVRNNSAGGSGGGIAVTGSTLNINNSTVAENHSSQSGGGLYKSDGTINIKNSIIADNTATTGADCAATIDSSNHNLLGDQSGCNITAGLGDVFDIDPLLSAIPETMTGSLPLEWNSPAVDAGDPDTCLGSDQRGVPRPQRAVCDMGAYELRITPGLSVSAGSDQHTGLNQPFALPLSVKVEGDVGQPLSGITVTFTGAAQGPSGTFADSGTTATTATTGEDGVATAASFTSNAEFGANSVVATAVGQPGMAVFALSNAGWFVSTTGRDENSCAVPAAPCRTINGAIAKAAAGEAIFVAQGTYTGTGSSPVVTISKSLVLFGGWDSTFTLQDDTSTIDGQDARQPLRIPGGVVSSLDHFNVSRGLAVQGGGIYNAGTLTLESSIVSRNNGNSTIGSVGWGGGIHNSGTLIVNNSSVSENVARYQGYGGGIYNSGTASLNSSTLYFNGAGSGGGIYNDGLLTVDNSTISSNSATFGGGLYFHAGSSDLNQVTVTENIATDSDRLAYGGGVYVSNTAVINSRNSIVAANVAEVYEDCSGSISSLGHNLVGNGNGCVIIPGAGDMVGAQDAPIDARLDNLQDNGGPTLTHALLGDSPAVDAGDVATCLQKDQRAIDRPQGPACDIGAFEGSEPGPVSAPAHTYSAENLYFLPGTPLCDQALPNCTNGVDLHADKAHMFAIGVYNLYLTKHGRISIDGSNMPIFSTVHYGDSDYANAYWSGAQMVYGDAYGFPLADDLVAHELTHGVTQYESNLYYYMESGAIDESLSDVWGEYYDQTNGLGNDADNVKWLIGEDVTGLGAIRSMSNPPAYGDPDKMTSTYFYKGTDDLGGVHHNSGVNNKAAFLMVQGGMFNSKTVTGIGWDKTASIYYEAQTHLLTTASDYADLYNILYQGCLNLVGGAGGISAADCQQVRNATDAVQLNKRASGYRPQADMCPAGTIKTADVFFDGLEEGTGNWTADLEVGSLHWTRQSFYPIAGSYHFFGNDYDSARSNDDQRSKSGVHLTSGIALAAGGAYYLHFKHAFEFEKYQTHNYDGGVLEYSTDNGWHWNDAGPLFSAGQGYNGTIFKYAYVYEEYGNPLGGQKGFINTSNGYVSTRYNLGSLAGQTVTFRWVLGTDFTGWANLGWAVDDIRIYKCVGVPSVPVLSSPANNALVTTYTPKLDWGNSSPAPDHYQLQLATNNTFTSPLPLVDDSTLTISELTVLPPLDPNTTFYWRVRAFNELGSASAWSSVRNFRTAIVPPTLLTPADAESLPNKRPMLDWADVAGASGYTVQIGKNNTFSSLQLTASPTGSTFTPASDLPANTTLYWRVQAKGTNGPSLWSATRSFTTGNPPSTPSLVAPANGALTTDYTPLLDWSTSTVPAGTTFSHYELEVDEDPAFGSPDLNEDIANLAGSNFTPLSNMAPNTKYFWRVRAFNTVGIVEHYSAWSAVRNFRTVIVPPTLVSPDDAVPLPNKRPTLDWGDVAGASGYTVQIGKNNTFTMLQLTGSATGSTFTPTGDLPANTTLYWRVQAKGTNGPSLWSATRSFTTGNPPSTPSLVAPANGALTTDYTPLLDWSTSTVPTGTTFSHYQLQADDDAAFGSPDLDEDIANLAGSNFTPLSNMAPNTKYFWRVRAFNTVGIVEHYSAWSAVRNFRTALTPPTLTLPAHLAVIADQTPLLDWEAVAGATGYSVQVSTSSSFASYRVNVSVSGEATTQYQVTSNLPLGQVIYWRVRANGANGPSQWTTQTFTVQ